MSSQTHPLDKAAACMPGGRADLARRLGVTPSAVGNWKRRGVPVEYCLAIEVLTAARVTRRELFADWKRVWPDLAEREEGAERDATAPGPAQEVAHG